MTEETKTPRTRTAHLPRPRRARVQQREKARAWLSVERRRYVTEHHVTSATARVAMPVPEVPLVRDGRTIVTDAVHVRRNIRRHGYILELSSRRELAHALLEATAKSVADVGAAVVKLINASSPDDSLYPEKLRQLRAAEHARVREYLRAEAAVENLPAVPRAPAALRPVDPETLRVPFPASRVYPVLATCTSPRRRGILSHRAARADEVAASRFLKRYPSASEFAVFDAEARSFARLQRMLAAQAEAQTVSTGQAVITT